MSQLEQLFRDYLTRHPEITKAYNTGLINRRALARHVIERAKIAKHSQFEAVLAMIRRFPFEKGAALQDLHSLFSEMAVKLRDDIIIVEIERSFAAQEVLKELKSLTNLSTDEVYKIVLGSSAITIFIAGNRLPVLQNSFSAT